jgi:hypothetical protein
MSKKSIKTLLLIEDNPGERAKPSVQQEKDFNQAVADSLPGLFYLINEHGQLVRWNETFHDVSGLWFAGERVFGRLGRYVTVAAESTETIPPKEVTLALRAHLRRIRR